MYNSLKFCSYKLIQKSFAPYTFLQCKNLHSSNVNYVNEKNDGSPTPTNNKAFSFEKFKQFNDEESIIVLDVEEERTKSKVSQRESSDTNDEIVYKRGITGVLDLEELVDELKDQKGEKIFVAEIPKQLHYVDHLVVVSGRSQRHIIGLAEHVRRLFKMKRHKNDIIPRIEGENSDWLALDLGNIALHIMSNKARKTYDLESLWGVGAKYDVQSTLAGNHLFELLQKHTINLDDLEPVKNL